MFSVLLNLLFPPFCQGCNRPGKWICASCWRNLNWLPPNQNTRALRHPSLRRVWSLVEYDEKVGKFIHGLKYSGYRVLAQPLGQAMARQLGDNVRKWKVEAILPVPLHPKRYRARGYNQAGLLAKEVGSRLEIPVDFDLLQRVIWTETQAHQDKMGRKNLHNMFRCSRKSPYSVVCLVDDVCTTGATLSACARALNQAGTKTIVAITVARA